MGITLKFKGNVFKQATKYKTKAAAEARKKRLKNTTHSKVRVTNFVLDKEGGKRKKGYAVWVSRS